MLPKRDRKYLAINKATKERLIKIRQDKDTPKEYKKSWSALINGLINYCEEADKE